MTHHAVQDHRPSPLARALRARLERGGHLTPGRRVVIGVAGESGSGKSVTAVDLAAALAEIGRRVAVLHQDDYFVRPPRTNHEYRLLDLAHVGPHEVNLHLIADHIGAFRRQESGVVGPRVDYPANRFETQVHDLATPDVLLVEGTYVLMLADLDVRIFLSATHEETAERRRRRARDIDAPVMQQILAIEHDVIAPQRARADIVVDEHFRIVGDA
ncbi:MAG: hypothetical protein U0163_03740 [Gemmatimonadaceae bacterium]